MYYTEYVGHGNSSWFSDTCFTEDDQTTITLTQKETLKYKKNSSKSRNQAVIDNYI